MSDKRIIDLEAKQTLGTGDFLAADSAQGTYKINANSNIMTPLTNVRNNVANSSASPDKYSSSTAYKVGDMVIQDDILYICTTACSAASWAVNSACFTATTLASAITQLNSDLNNLKFKEIQKTVNLVVGDNTIDLSNEMPNNTIYFDFYMFKNKESMFKLPYFGSGTDFNTITYVKTMDTTNKTILICVKGSPWPNYTMSGIFIYK